MDWSLEERILGLGLEEESRVLRLMGSLRGEDLMEAKGGAWGWRWLLLAVESMATVRVSVCVVAL